MITPTRKNHYATCNLWIQILFITFLIILWHPVDVIAQKFATGVKVGLNTSTHFKRFRIESNDLNLSLSPNFTVGFSFGLIHRYQFNSRFRIQAEPTFSQLGASYNESFRFRGNQFQTDSETDLRYIQLPILIQLTTTPPQYTSPPTPWAITTWHISLGFYGGYLFDADFSGTNSGSPLGITFSENFSNDVTNQYKNFDSGVIVGGGMEYGFKKKFGVEARFIYGVMNTGSSKFPKFDPNNMGITLSIYALI